VLPLLTERLQLRPLRESDADQLFRLYSDPSVSSYVGRHTRADVEEELRFDIAHQAAYGWAMWAVQERAGGAFVGACGLRPLEMRGPEVELAYDLFPRFWGRGLAGEAAAATISLALGELALERVIGVVKPAHLASRRVLEKAGLVYVEIRHAYGERLLLYETARLKDGGHSAEA
jgi:ribosomal-protein-alanine N-acetyltransferase